MSFDTDFNSRLKTALVGRPDTGLVFIGNFEVEDQWAIGERGLPRVAFKTGNAVVNRMDEFALLLAGRDDHVVLKTAPDPDYLGYLEGLGIELPRLICPEHQDPDRTVTEDALEDPGVLTALAGLAERGWHLSPHGVSELEERLAEKTSLSLAAPAAAICKAVNSKIYSRLIADDLRLRQAQGWTCATLTELEAGFAAAAELLAAGRRVVVKDAFGVSGKGIMVVDEERRLDQLHRMIATRARRAGEDRVALVVEDWVAKRADLNYQFTIGRDGAVRFDFVKEALTEGGVHKGHRIPARLSATQVDELTEVAQALGSRLAADGFYGVVGVDAMVDPDGGLYPVVEINARNNMSTYQARLQEAFIDEGKVALVRQYPLRLMERLPFGRLRESLGDLLLEREGGIGLLVNNYATVNAAARTDSDFDGRLYGLVIADSADRMQALDDEITNRLAALEESRR